MSYVQDAIDLLAEAHKVVERPRRDLDAGKWVQGIGLLLVTEKLIVQMEDALNTHVSTMTGGKFVFRDGAIVRADDALTPPQNGEER